MKLTKIVYDLINKHGLLRETFVSLQAHFTDRKYAVMSSGHGSEYRFDGPNPDKPPFPLLNIKDAVFDCRFWVGYACTIAGNATIVNAGSGKKINWEDYLKYDWVKKREIFDLENRLPDLTRYMQGSLSEEEIKKAETEFEGFNEVFSYQDWRVKKLGGKNPFLPLIFRFLKIEPNDVRFLLRSKSSNEVRKSRRGQS